MVRVFKKLSVLVVFSLMISGLSACGGDSKKTSSEEKGEGKTAAIKIFTSAQVKTDADKAWLEYVEKENNIKIEFETPPESNYKERLQIMLVSGTYPDLVLFNNHNDSEFRSAVNNGVIVPVNKYLDEAKNLKEYSYQSDFDALKVKQDANIYGIPRSSVLRADGFAIRKDWLDAVGLSVKENEAVTLEEFEEILRRFTFNDPDGNGKKDTYGISSYSSANTGLRMSIIHTFGLFGWQKVQEGPYTYMNPQYSRSTDNYKKALAYNAKLFKEGLINPDSPVLTTSVMMETKFKQGVAGVCSIFPGHVFSWEKEMKKVNADAKLVYITGIKDSEGKVKLGVPSVGYYGFWAITNTNKEPVKTVKLLDWMVSDGVWQTSTMYGMEGSAYTVQDGKKVFSDKKFDIGRAFVRRNNDPEFFISPETPDDIKSQLKENIQQGMSNIVQSKDRGFLPDASQRLDMIDYQKKMSEITTKILIGVLPESEYDKALDGWYKAGGEEYVKQMNDYLKKMEQQ